MGSSISYLFGVETCISRSFILYFSLLQHLKVCSTDVLQLVIHLTLNRYLDNIFLVSYSVHACVNLVRSLTLMGLLIGGFG